MNFFAVVIAQKTGRTKIHFILQVLKRLDLDCAEFTMLLRAGQVYAMEGRHMGLISVLMIINKSLI